MALTESKTDHPARRGWASFVLRTGGVLVAIYGVWASKVLTGGSWMVGLTVLAWVAMVGLLFLRLGPWSRWQSVMAAVMMLSGAAVSPFAAYVPVYFVVVGGLVLVGQVRVRLHIALLVTAASAVVLGVGAVIAGDSRWTVVSVLAGVGAVTLGGLNRRQARERRRQDAELVARSRELERRSQDLINQTELTRSETARAAALEERGRIARDVHDVLAHSLGGLVVQLDAAEALLTERGDVDAAADRLRVSRALAVEGLREARKAVEGWQEERLTDAGQEVSQPVTALRTPSADDVDVEVDLPTALSPLVRGPVGLGVGAVLDVVGAERPVAGRVAAALVAVTREALTNVNKHAPGGPAAVTVVFGKGLRVEIGSPLPTSSDPEHPLLAASGTGLGLVGMRSRLVGVAGTLRAGAEGRRWLVVAEVAVPVENPHE